MKQVLLIVAILVSSLAFAQEEKTPIKNETRSDEIRINGMLIVSGAFEISYEKLLNEESGVGVSLMIPFADEVKKTYKYYVSPYYRFYFGEKYASGFFFEGFGMLNSMNRTEILFSQPKYETDFGIGIGIGGKWITKGGFFGELNFGIGRNLFKNKDNFNNVLGKGGISLGYRF